jgi:hypothetical protein
MKFGTRSLLLLKYLKCIMELHNNIINTDLLFMLYKFLFMLMIYYTT